MTAIPRRTITLAMTGASGAAYGLRLIDCLLQADCQVYFMLSEAARTVIQMETGTTLPRTSTEIEAYFSEQFPTHPGRLRHFDLMDWLAPPASGTGDNIPMVICPASGGLVSAIAHGASTNLIQRAADVAIKEKRPLIIVPREMPASVIHLENQLKLAQLGVTVMPASPGFYQHPNTIADLVDFVVSRILDTLSIPHTLLPRWGQ